MKNVREVVRKLDPNLSEKDKAFSAAMVLVGASQVGTNADKIAARTKLPRTTVRQYVKRLRKQGVFVGSKISCEWFDKKTGSVAFWMDVCVAEGLMKRVSAQ